jgi:uncharacterized protein (TIGR03435 family)
MSSLVSFLKERFSLPIVDETGLTEHYDFSIPGMHDWWNNPDGLKTVLHDQLGLDLVADRKPIEMLVVEKVK